MGLENEIITLKNVLHPLQVLRQIEPYIVIELCGCGWPPEDNLTISFLHLKVLKDLKCIANEVYVRGSMGSIFSIMRYLASI